MTRGTCDRSRHIDYNSVTTFPWRSQMSIDFEALHALPVAEKMQLVEMLWDDLGGSTTPIPLPEWVKTEVAHQRREMTDPAYGLSHEEIWRRISIRNG